MPKRSRKFYETDLPKEAKPTEWNQLAASRLEEELKVHRWLDCPHYGLCLHHASGNYWEGWSCHWCSLNKSAEERKKY